MRLIVAVRLEGRKRAPPQLKRRSVAGTSFSRKIDRSMIVRGIDQVRAARIRPASGRSLHIQRADDDERCGGKL